MAMTLTGAKKSKETHWIESVVLCAKISSGVLVINLIFVGIADRLSSRYPDNETFSSVAIVYRENCASINRWAIALHILINILSTAVLAASNYSMHTLMASYWFCQYQKSFCDPSNSFALWFVLMITATPFHLM